MAGVTAGGGVRGIVIRVVAFHKHLRHVRGSSLSDAMDICVVGRPPKLTGARPE